ncbi:hypothetical protein F5887DRAFT_1182675 [Amanita rubescens]|nr:hypothetical protein F5887DRAFT_1182675 [Amanita rubescens]
MASNTLGQSTRLVYHDLAPALSLGGGANFALGECVLVRIPERIQVEGHVEDEATAVGTGLPPTTNGRTPQLFAFIREMEVLPDGSYVLEVYPVVSFTRSGGALPTYNRLTDAAKALLLPLPPLSFCHPTPEAFGARLNLGTWRDSRDSFLLVNPRRFVMPTSRPLPGDGGEKVAGAGLEEFSVKSSHGLLVLEGVDEDAEGPDATMLDQLMMLAYDDPIWSEELRRYLQKEEEEREQMQKERAVRLARWREDVVVQPT